VGQGEVFYFEGAWLLYGREPFAQGMIISAVPQFVSETRSDLFDRLNDVTEQSL
jgi:hypothetical protein